VTVLAMLRSDPRALPVWVTLVALSCVVVTSFFALGNLFSAAMGKSGVRFGDIIEEEEFAPRSCGEHRQLE
jgi:hypothetical protein